MTELVLPWLPYFAVLPRRLENGSLGWGRLERKVSHHVIHEDWNTYWFRPINVRVPVFKYRRAR